MSDGGDDDDDDTTHSWCSDSNSSIVSNSAMIQHSMKECIRRVCVHCI